MTTRPGSGRTGKFLCPRGRLTFANLTALLALFVALGGTSYAALQLPRNSVGAKQIKKNSVTSPKVKPGSLLTSDFKPSQRARLRGPRGPQGAQGDRGVPGPTQFARVLTSGALNSGTASSASRPATGVYQINFPTAVDSCAGSATTAAFPGFDGAENQVSSSITIGGTAAGALDARAITVRLYQSYSGAALNTSFAVVLACP